MATNQRKTTARPAAKAKRSKSKIVVFAVEIVIILVMLAVLYLVMNTNSSGPKVTVIDPGELAIPEEIKQAKEEGESSMLGYMNIALFGVDAVNDKQLTKNSRSDSTMIASVNMDSGDIKLVSIYRDSYLNTGTDTYEKCNAAYAKGGAKQAIKMLNMNLDMDIEKFVAVGYNSVIELIDALGGVYVDVDKAEIPHLNNYQASIVLAWKYGVKISETMDASLWNKLKPGDYTPVTETGYQLLNGLQATAYCRIRYTAGDDYKRAERQREVLKAIEAQAKKMSVTDLQKVFNSVIESVYTNIETEDLLALLSKINDFQIVDQDGFPKAEMRTSGLIGAKGSCVVPTDLEQNVVWLHEFLFGEKDYEVTRTVREISSHIKADTDPYLNK